jgi:hypothetical protein
MAGIRPCGRVFPLPRRTRFVDIAMPLPDCGFEDLIEAANP